MLVLKPPFQKKEVLLFITASRACLLLTVMKYGQTVTATRNVGEKRKRGSVIYSMCFAYCMGPSIMGHKVLTAHALITTMKISCYAQGERGELKKRKSDKNACFSICYKATATMQSTLGQRSVSMAHQVQFKAYLN